MAVPVPGWLPALVATGVAVLLLWAALEKARSRSSFTETVRGLGLAGTPARLVTAAVPGAEIVVALALLAAPGWVLPRIGVAVLGIAFGAAGLVALRRDSVVPCSCFGGVGGGTLGRRQVAAVPLWLAAVAVMGLPAATAAPNPEARVLAVASCALVLCASRAAGVVVAWRRARDDRRALGGATG